MKKHSLYYRFSFFKIILIFIIILPLNLSGQTIRVVVYNDPPFVYLNEDKVPSGFYIELLKDIAIHQGWELSFKYYEVNDIVSASKKKEFDIIPDVIINSLADFNHGKETVFTSWGQVYYTGDFSLDKITDLAEKIIVVQKGDYIVRAKEDGFIDLLNSFEIKCNWIYVKTYEEVFEKIQSGEADAGVVNNVFGEMNSKKYRIKASDIIFSPIATGFASPSKTPEMDKILNIIDQEIRIYKSDTSSIYYKFVNKYFVDREHLSLPSWLIPALILGSIFIILAVAVGFFLRFQVKNRTFQLSNTNTELKASKSKIERINSKLEESNRKFSTLVNNLQGVAFRAKNKREWPMEFISDGVVELTGFEPKSFLKPDDFNWLSIVYHEDMQKVWNEIQMQLSKGNSYEIIYRILDSNNQIKWVNEKGEGIYDAKQNIIAVEGFINDITQLKENEISLVRHKQNLENTIRQRTKEITKKNKELSISNQELFIINEQLITEIAERKLAQERSANLSNELQETNVQLEERQEEILQQAEMLAVTNEELEVKKNILETTLKELKNAQFKLIQSEKMASVGQLTAGIAHEINNPVNFINAGIDSLGTILNDIMNIIKRYDDINSENYSEKIKEIKEIKLEYNYEKLIQGVEKLTKNIKTGAVRTTQIVKSLRVFSRLDENDVRLVNIHENIDSTLVMLQNKYKNRIEVVKDYSLIPLVECFPGKMNQVFMNLLVNAIDAIPDKGKITIKTGQSEEMENDKPKFIYLSIKDTGTGISSEVLNRIFEPFYTTKDIGKGTGLGLSISYSIIQDHHGEIEVFSQEGTGTEFFITLPLRIDLKK